MIRRRRKTEARKPLRVMGVDPSLNATGVALPDESCVVVQPNSKGWTRYHYVLERLAIMVDQHGVSHVALEGYSFGSKLQRGNYDRAELCGMMKLLFLSRGLNIVVVPPTTLKKYATGKGNAPKELVMREVKRRWGKSFVSSDKADAFALQQFGLDYFGKSTDSQGDIRAVREGLLIQSTKELQTFAEIG